MQNMALRGPDAEPQPGLESQGRAASMPRLAAETQVGSFGRAMRREVGSMTMFILRVRSGSGEKWALPGSLL